MSYLKSVSYEELRYIKEHLITVWHFEKCDGGVKPVKGEYDPDNPNHVKKSSVIDCGRRKHILK